MAAIATRPAGAAVVLVILLAGSASACIYKFGTAKDSLAPHAATPWDHGMNGDDWAGTCSTGKRQSPLNIPTYQVLDGKGPGVPAQLQTQWSYPSLVSNGSNIEIINNGHTIQVEWLGQYNADVEIAVPAKRDSTTKITSVLDMKASDMADRVSAQPVQFHFHTNSEHLLGGVYYPLELHIVHKITDPKLPACAGGCFSVTGILFKLTNDGDNPLIQAILDNAPTREGTINYLPKGDVIPLGDLLPDPEHRQYVTYEGSLTTPPCSEGLLWHVLTKPQTISHRQMVAYHKAVGFKDCTQVNGTDAHHHRHMARRLLDSNTTDPNAYDCKVVAYGYNYRTAQPRNNRIIKMAK